MDWLRLLHSASSPVDELFIYGHNLSMQSEMDQQHRKSTSIPDQYNLKVYGAVDKKVGGLRINGH